MSIFTTRRFPVAKSGIRGGGSRDRQRDAAGTRPLNDGDETAVPANLPDITLSGPMGRGRVVRFISKGLRFEKMADRCCPIYTIDGGAHWRQQSLPQLSKTAKLSTNFCAVVAILDLHPK